MSAIADVVSNLVGAIQNGFDWIYSFFSDLISAVLDVLNYINPFSENFILRIAFIPSDGFFDEQILQLKESAFEDVAVIDDLISRLDSLQGVSEKSRFDGFDADFSHLGAGDVKVIDETPINYFSSHIKSWLSGFMWVFCIYYIIRHMSTVLDS